MFLDRLAARLGESTCRTGKHQDWPAGSRYDAFMDPTAVTGRQDLFTPTPTRHVSYALPQHPAEQADFPDAALLSGMSALSSTVRKQRSRRTAGG